MKGAAKQFIDSKLAIGVFSFSLSDLVKSTGLSEIAANNQLRRIGEAVVRVTPRQPYFLIVTPEYREFGAPPPLLWLDDYFNWLGHPYYLALQSAAALYGSSQQAVQEVQVITNVQISDIVFSRVRVRFYFKLATAEAQIQQAPSAHAPLNVSTPETTAYDLIRYASSIGGIERAAETIYPMMQEMNSRRLKKVLDVGREISTAQRLGYILKNGEANKLERVVLDWLPKYKKIIPINLGAEVSHDMDINKEYGLILNTSGASLWH